MKPYRQPPGMTGGAAKMRAVVTTALRFVAAYRLLDDTPVTTVGYRAAQAEFDAARDECFAACDALAPGKGPTR